MRERKEGKVQYENGIPARENVEPLSTPSVNLQKAIAIIMDEVSTNCPIEELMSVVADVAMKYHDGDSAFFFNYDKGMKTAQCTYETHRANFPPICGTEPMYLDEYPGLLTMMVDVLTGIAAKKEFIFFPDLSSLLPAKSKESRRMNQIGLRSLLGIAYNDCRDFIVVVNPREHTDQGEVLRVMSYVLTTEIEKHGIHLPDRISFGKGELAENEAYIGLLNGFELRTKYGAITEQELTSGRVITFLTLLLFQEDHMLSKKTIIDKIWGEENLLSHKTRTLNDVGYKAVKSIKGLFPSKEFLEKDKYHYFINRNYKITTELDAISYEIRDIEGMGDDELRLKKYLELLDRLSATILPRQKHTGIEHIEHGYDEKKKDGQNTVLELMCQLKLYEEMHSFIHSLSITRSGDIELAYWDIKALEGLGKHSFAYEQYQINQENFSASQQHELAELLGVEMP
ncbi:MAG: hypothetical protein LUC47_01680 [Clostridiales bacterium]|nr:hypothetical protein [Clostridiales bacterium]